MKQSPPRSDPTVSIDPRSALMIWIGAWSGILGVLIYCLGQSDDMLPFDRSLLALSGIAMILLLDFPGASAKGRHRPDHRRFRKAAALRSARR